MNAIYISSTTLTETICKINCHSCNILAGNFVAFLTSKNLCVFIYIQHKLVKLDVQSTYTHRMKKTDVYTFIQNRQEAKIVSE